MAHSKKRQNPEQIPSNENIGKTSAVISEQGGVPGQRKEVDVSDYSKAAAVGQILKDLEFPADRRAIVEHAGRALAQGEQILQDLQKIEERQYKNVSEVAQAAGLVKH